MKNTLENKAKFFAQYWEQEVFLSNERSGIFLLLNPRDEFGMIQLKPISSITDEDARKLGFRDSGHFKFDGNEYGRKDELRLLGYAVEWCDLSVDELVEYGWVKLG